MSEEQIILAVGVTQEANDAQQLEPMLQTVAHTLEAVPEIAWLIIGEAVLSSPTKAFTLKLILGRWVVY